MSDSRRLRFARAVAPAAAVAVVLGACGGDYPSRDWSGNYLARMIASSSDCYQSPLPPPLLAFTLNVEQHPNNRVSVWMNPIIQLSGSFDGDHLDAQAMFAEQVTLPDSLRARLTPADSFEVIAYDFDGDFDGNGFEAHYTIRTPDVRALAAGAEKLRCTYEYDLVGTVFEPQPLSEQPWSQELAPAGPAQPGIAPPDSPARRDAIGAPAESL